MACRGALTQRFAPCTARHHVESTGALTDPDTTSRASAPTGTRLAGSILVADDEDDIRELLRELIELRGYLVVTARDGQEVLDILRSSIPICFVLMDLAMPGVSGLDVLRELRAHPQLRRAPLWISTATPRQVPDDVPCLPKPLNVKRLFELLTIHCLRRS